MLKTTRSILRNADKHGYAVPAFNVNNLEILRAVIDTAIAEHSPVILATSEGAIEYAGMDYLLSMLQIAAKAPVPVAIHLDHGKNLQVIKKAIASGYSSVMIDASLLPYKDNVATTKKVVAWAKEKGVSVEAEIGAIQGVEDLVSVSEKEAFFTDPDEARRFVKDTRCDALAISIGTAHGAFKFKEEAQLDMKRLSAINAMVSVPLVLHGASGISDAFVEKTKTQCSLLGDCNRLSGAKGVPDSEIKKAIAHGIRKINIDSDMRIAFTAGIRQAILDMKSEIDPRKLMRPAVTLMQEVARHKMQLFGSSGKATTR